MARLKHLLAAPILPFLVLWVVLSYIVAYLVGLLLLWLPCFNPYPSRFYETLPFVPHIFESKSRIRAAYLRMVFDYGITVNNVRRALTRPLRRSLPSFYIVGFPKAGTTTLANHLRNCPGIVGLDGLSFHETMQKESHFFQGIMGRDRAHQARLYASLFPTYLTQWWNEVVRGVPKYMVFDACPVHVCLPYVAERIARVTPDAKIVILLRDPIKAIFSGETMMRNIGVRLPYSSYMDKVQPCDARFIEYPDDERLWSQMEGLGPEETLPEGMMERFYFSPSTNLYVGRIYDRVLPYLKHFKKEQLLFVSFDELVKNEESVVRQVLTFVGAEEKLFRYKKMPVGMQGSYGEGSKMHPSVRAYFRSVFHDSNRMLFSLLGRDFGWSREEPV